MHTVKWLNNSIWPIDRTITGANTLGQSGPGSNDNEGVTHIFQKSRAGASPSDLFSVISEHILVGESYASEEM